MGEVGVIDLLRRRATLRRLSAMATDQHEPILQPVAGQTDAASSASAVDRDGDPIHEVAPALVADVLEVGLVDSWRVNEESTFPGPYRPHVVLHGEDGSSRRSFIVEDLKPEDEVPLRSLAVQSANNFVRGRIFDVLWVRYGNHQDAHAAIDALMAAAATFTGEKRWPEMVSLLGRAATLIVKTNARTKLSALLDALEDAGQRVLAGCYDFGFGRLAEMVRLVVIAASWGKQEFGEARADRWIGTLGFLAEQHAHDHHHGQNAFHELQAWQGRWGRQPQQRAIQERMVDELQAIASGQPRSIAPSTLQTALSRALAFGLSGHVEEVRLRLSEAIRAAVPEFQTISGSAKIPADAIEELERLVENSPNPSVAVRQLAVLPGLLEVPLDDFRNAAEQRLKDQLFWRFARSIHYHDGKVTFSGRNDEAKTNESLALFASFHQAFVEALLGHFLRLTHERFRDDTMFEALAGWPHLAAVRQPLLARASERFARSDFVSSGVLVTTLYEAVLRDLLRAGGYSALKTDTSGIMADETLNSLLQNLRTKDILGEGHVWFVEHVLCRAHLGPNMRNAIAHGTATTEALTPTRVLLAWLLLVRVTTLTWTSPAASN